MTHRSIRVRLTAFYAGMVALATLGLALGSGWILSLGITRQADLDLESRVAGVRRFVEHVEAELPAPELRDEFEEYAELTHSEALIEVRDPSGAPLVRPALAGWDLLVAQAPVASPQVRFAAAQLRGNPFRVASAEIAVEGRGHRVIVALPMAGAYSVLRQVRLLFGILLPLCVLLAAAGGYWLTGRALLPVGRMTRAARAITVHKLDQRLELPATDDELRDLATTFNEMLARLQASVRDIVRFTADASHELRSPVSRVRTTAELALRRERTTSEYRQALSEVLGEAEHMSRLVQELLALAREDTGIEPREAAAFNLVDVAADALRALDGHAAGAVTLDLEASNGRIELHGDPSRVRRLLLILLENALAYTPRGGEIRLRVVPGSTSAGRVARIEVRDSGTGIDSRDLPHVFERFYRGAAARELSPDGSGLGLAIAREIVEACGGTLRIENNPPPAAGCTALVELPTS